MSETLAARAEQWAVLYDTVGYRDDEGVAATLRALAEANVRLERERNEAHETLDEIRHQLAIEDQPDRSVHEAISETILERDAAIAARVAAEGERDRLLPVLKAAREIWQWHDTTTDGRGGFMIRRIKELQAAIAEYDHEARAALTPAPEAPKDGE